MAFTSSSRRIRCVHRAVGSVSGRPVGLPAATQHNVPVFGAIMVNPAMDKCLRVKGWKSGASWGFPKGKVRALPHLCACLSCS